MAVLTLQCVVESSLGGRIFELGCGELFKMRKINLQSGHVGLESVVVMEGF